jgi:hypothetical protein
VPTTFQELTGGGLALAVIAGVILAGYGISLMIDK